MATIEIPANCTNIDWKWNFWISLMVESSMSISLWCHLVCIAQTDPGLDIARDVGSWKWKVFIQSHIFNFEMYCNDSEFTSACIERHLWFVLNGQNNKLTVGWFRAHNSKCNSYFCSRTKWRRSYAHRM